MKKFFKSKAGIVAAAAIAIAITTALTTYFLGGQANFLQNIVSTVTKPFQAGLTFLVDQLESLYGYIYEYDSLKAENESLKVKIAEMEDTHREAESAIKERDQLRKLTDLRARRQDITEMEAVTITARNPSNWAYTFTVSKGSSSGIELNDVVITEEGRVVGLIVGLGSNTATVRVTIDPSMNVGASISRSGAAGVLEGDFLLMQKGCAKLSYLPSSTEILTGDVIVTSGMGGLFPQGLVLGTVESVDYEGSGLTKYAAIKPSVDLNELSRVFVIKSFDIEE